MAGFLDEKFVETAPLTVYNAGSALLFPTHNERIALTLACVSLHLASAYIPSVDKAPLWLSWAILWATTEVVIAIWLYRTDVERPRSRRVQGQTTEILVAVAMVGATALEQAECVRWAWVSKNGQRTAE